jgi:hypothetical protein
MNIYTFLCVKRNKLPESSFTGKPGKIAADSGSGINRPLFRLACLCFDK